MHAAQSSVGKVLSNLRHVAADGRLALHQVDVLAGVGQGQRGVDARDAAAHHQHIGMDRHAACVSSGSCHATRRTAARTRSLAFSRGLRLVGVHPGIVLPDVDHLEVVGIQAACCHGRAGKCARAGAASRRPPRCGSARGRGCPAGSAPGRGRSTCTCTPGPPPRPAGRRHTGQGLHVHRGGDIGAAVADVNADSRAVAQLPHGLLH